MINGAKRLLIFTCLILTCFITLSQTSVSGDIFDIRNKKPLPNVSINVLKKSMGSLSDASGHFKVSGQKLKKTDTLVLSSIGYATLKIPITEAVSQKQFFLSEEPREMENVVIKTYLNHSSEGAVSEVTGYFTSWTTRKDGGEIGRIIQVRSDDFKVEKVRFKANNQCDTCTFRLHIRGLNNGLPDMDLLRDSITVTTHNKSSFDDKYTEFDLSDKNIIIKKNRYVFVSLETIHCNSADNSSCSLSYIGTEEGSYLYRTKDYRPWEESTANSLYIKMFYTY